MLYPNFENQASFSTNHLEVGAHISKFTKSKGRHKSRDFTVPLLTDPKQLRGFRIGPLEELPIFDLFGKAWLTRDTMRRALLSEHTRRPATPAAANPVVGALLHSSNPFADANSDPSNPLLCQSATLSQGTNLSLYNGMRKLRSCVPRDSKTARGYGYSALVDHGGVLKVKRSPLPCVLGTCTAEDVWQSTEGPPCGGVGSSKEATSSSAPSACSPNISRLEHTMTVSAHGTLEIHRFHKSGVKELVWSSSVVGETTRRKVGEYYARLEGDGNLGALLLLRMRHASMC